jgi:S1-C subfamily serine protease
MNKPLFSCALSASAFLGLSLSPPAEQDAEQDPSAIVVAQGGGVAVDDPDLAAAMRLQQTLLNISEKVRPSIVTVAAFERVPETELAAAEALEPALRPTWTRELDQDLKGFRRIGSGSGVVVSQAGHIITNRHFLLKADGSEPDLIDVETVDNRHTLTRIVGLEPTVNLAVLQLDVFSPGNPPAYAPLPFGNSFGVLPGNLALAMGDPFGPEKYFGMGVFSGTPNRECYQEQLSATYLQAAMHIHPGAYGGAMVDLQGNLIGMLSPRNLELGAAGNMVGIEFALPSNIIRALYPTILKNESRVSPWLGFAVMSGIELQRELGIEGYSKLLKPRAGIYIENLFDPSPAHAAGVKIGDFLTRFDGAIIGGPLDFQRAMYMAGVGRSVELEFFRAGETYSVRVEVEPRPDTAITR